MITIYIYRRETSSKTKNGLKELASNVARALAKKADRSEVRKYAKERDDRENFGSHSQLQSQQHNYHHHTGASMGSAIGESDASMIQAALHHHDGNGGDVSKSSYKTLSSDLLAVRKEIGVCMSVSADNKTQLQELRRELSEEVEALRIQQQQQSKKQSRLSLSSSSGSSSTPTKYGHSNSSGSSGHTPNKSGRGSSGVGSNFTEWRMALGDLSLNLRRYGCIYACTVHLTSM